MPATIIDGKAIAETIRNELKAEIEAFRAEHPTAPPPGLAAIIVGTRKDSETYVRLKKKAAEECGFLSIPAEMPEDTTQEQLEAKIAELNADPNCHGIIVQLPLPSHLSEHDAVNKVSPTKDADCLHPLNVGLMALKGSHPVFLPCTPAGVVELLKRSGVALSGKNAVVMGRSNIVGMPVSLLLLKENCTVTVVHSATKDIDKIVSQADVLVTAMGRPESVPGAWLKPGCAVIDVSTSPVTDATKKAGFRLVGDVVFSEAVEVASCITPVPGGVGPMTIAMLLQNTIRGWKKTVA